MKNLPINKFGNIFASQQINREKSKKLLIELLIESDKFPEHFFLAASLGLSGFESHRVFSLPTFRTKIYVL